MCRHEYADAAENTGAEQKAGEDIVAVQTGVNSCHDQKDKRGKSEQHADQPIEMVIALRLCGNGEIVPNGLLRHLQYSFAAAGQDALVLAQLPRIRKGAGKALRLDDVDQPGNQLLALDAGQMGEKRIEYLFDGGFERIAGAFFRRPGSCWFVWRQA